MADGTTGPGGGGDGFVGYGSSAGMSSAQATADAKVFAETLGKQTQVYREITNAAEGYGRLAKQNRKEHEKMRDVLREDAKAAMEYSKQLFTLKGQYEDVRGVAKGYAQQLMQLGSISNVYAAKLKYMREGQEAFTKSLVATTGDANKAMEKSQQYVNAVHAAYANVHSVAGEFLMDAETIKKSVGELSDRFATQIAASNDMAGSMKSMQREAVVMSRYLGVDMKQVMDAWDDQMQQSNMTLEQSRKEFVAVTYVTDKYAKELAALGDRFLKTGNIGKNEFLKMVQDVGKEMRTGIYDASAYANALKGLMIQSKKAGHTANEQRSIAEGTKKFIASMSDFQGSGAVFGMKAAQKMMTDVESGKMKFKDSAMQQRVENIIKSGNAPVYKMQAIMEATQGNAEANALKLETATNMMGKNSQVALTLTREAMGGSAYLGMELADRLKSGELAADYRKEADAEASSQREEQVEVWKKGIEDMVKAGATPKDLDYKVIAEIEKANQWLKKITTEFPLWLAGIQLGGSLVKAVGGRILKAIGARIAASALTTGASTVAAGAAPAAAATAGGGGAGASALSIGGRIAGIAGRFAPALGPAGIVLAGGTLLGMGAVALEKHMLSEAEKSGDLLSGAYDDYAGFLLNRAVHGEEVAKTFDRMTQAEKEKRFKLLKLQEEEIAILEKHKAILSETNLEKLKQLKREKAANEKALGARIHRRAAESAAVQYERSKELDDTLEERIKMLGAKGAMPTTSKKFVEEVMFANLGHDRKLKKTDLMSGDLPAAISAMFDRLPEELKKTLNKKEIYEEAVKAVQMNAAARSAASLPAFLQGDVEATTAATRDAAAVGTWSKEKLAENWRRKRGVDFAAMPDAAQLNAARQYEAAVRDINVRFSQNSDMESDEVGTALPSSLNAKGELRVPQRPIVLNLSAINDNLAKQKTRDTHD